MNIGSSNKPMYDNCAYQKKLYESTTPLTYQLYDGKFENCKKCHFEDQFWRPYDLVNIESELKNITRSATQCPQFKYNPSCPKSKSCISTFDKSIPVVSAPDVCPIVFNNIRKMTTPGYTLDTSVLCRK